MTLPFEDIGIVVLGMLVLFTLYQLRQASHAASQRRVRQMVEASAFLEQHARALEKFLDDPDAPKELKVALIEASDALADRAVVKSMADWIALRPVEAPMDGPRASAMREALENLSRTRSDLSANFATAVITGAIGAFLRWPESASLFDQVGARIAADPQREIDFAVTAASLRANTGFGLRPVMPAMT